MKEVLAKVDILGRITKWNIKLIKFEIDITLRMAIKGQMLVDFLVECSFKRNEDTTEVIQLPRNDNMRVDALSKLASSITIEQRGKILLEHKETLSYDVPQVLFATQEETWMTFIIHTLQGKEESQDRKELAK
ncbi:hypothetical protein PVK06_020749 [Gossypium arboreum]|uniref:Uncharacterized protein n=1 Tax=Gossypium arboreum TaxID=29729 RepID=A0ABR0PN72_GOSAR|nr:hypothetical protein PVK06_020749 [Gossypium arboreum]